MKHDEAVTDAWRDYLAGVEYYGRLGLYNKVNLNEAFYAGDQWRDSLGNRIETNGLPAPVFNMFKQIIDYLISTVLSKEVGFNYSVEGVSQSELYGSKNNIKRACARISAYARHKWEQSKMDNILSDALLDAAISGNGVFFTYWDKDSLTGGKYKGDFVTKVIDSVNVFPADPTTYDFEKQKYIIVSGRETVDALRREALANGVDEALAMGIMPDGESGYQAGNLAKKEPVGTKCTVLIRFWRDSETGTIKFKKYTKTTPITGEVDTGLRHYPLTHFAWDKRKGSWIGQALATGLVPNQRYINQSFSMVMYHMMMTAFSKIVYNADKIDGEWDNSVGAAIPVIGDVDNVAKVIDCGQMQPGMLETIDKAISYTKEITGATDVALGLAKPENASAIAALNEAALIPMEITKRNLYSALEQLGMIWLDFMMAYFPDDRLIVYGDNGAKMSESSFNASCLRECLTICRVDLTPINYNNSMTSIETLDKLLNKGFITFEQYLERIPNGIVPRKYELISALKEKQQNDETIKNSKE